MIEFCFPMKYNANKIVIPVIKMSERANVPNTLIPQHYYKIFFLST